MEFYGPHRELLAQIYQRCEEREWFGPEFEDPHRSKHDDIIIVGHLSEEEIRKGTPFLTELNYRYVIDEGGPLTIVSLASDVRRHRFLHPPATAEQIAQTEKIWGFPMSSILHDIYTQLANGGFGFWGGFFGVVGGAEMEGFGVTRNNWKLTDIVPNGLAEKDEIFYCYNFPDRFIPWAEWGCDIFSWIDGWTERVYQSGWCSLEAAQVKNQRRPVDVPPDNPYFHTHNICHGLRYEASSLEEWLTMWLDGRLKRYF